MPLPMMDVPSPGQGRLLHRCAPSWAPDCPRWGRGCWRSTISREPCGSTCPLQASGAPHLPVPLPVLMRALCHSQSPARPSARFVIRLLRERRGRVTNEHIQPAESPQPLIESARSWELMGVRRAPCAGKDLPCKNPRLREAAEEEQPRSPVPRWQWHQGHTDPHGTAAPQTLRLPQSCILTGLG